MHKTKPNETKACFKHLYAIQPGMDRPILQLPGPHRAYKPMSYILELWPLVIWQSLMAVLVSAAD